MFALKNVFTNSTENVIWDKVLNNEPSKICGRQVFALHSYLRYLSYTSVWFLGLFELITI